MRTTSVLALAILAASCGDIQSPTAPSPIATSRITISASAPAFLTSGSTLTLTAHVSGSDNVNVRDVTVHWTTSTGGLSATDARTVGDSGDASVTLTGSTPTTVTASAQGVTATRTLDVLEPFRVEVSANPQAFTDGTETFVTVQRATGVSDVLPAGLTLSCGTGAPLSLAPAFGTTQARCTFPAPGDYTITANASTANGWRTSASTRVTVATRAGPSVPGAPAPAVTVAVRTFGPDSQRGVTVVTDVTPDGQAETFDYDFGDGVRTGPIASSQTTHYYAARGTFPIRVTVRTVDGRTFVSGASVVIP